MSYRIVAFHYPKPQFRDELLQRLVSAAEIIKAAPGCIDVEVWKEQARHALVSTAKFDSRDSCMSALRTTAQATDIQFDEREERAREIYDLVEPG
ncbi:MAG TPA: antibiotic biosynthesis monooxygenase [Xanthobacteraceae bacterium]|nr:antibiotic biosynthesis monooxygenase [Xanthobacteraceae bacterium]